MTKEESRTSQDRVVFLCSIAVLISLLTVVVAKLLVLLINFVTNLVFLHHFSVADATPSQALSPLWFVLAPPLGGLIVGFLARYGSAAIRGHGIPEAMEQVLTNCSRIPPRVTILKPLSSAIAIGTGGPFGAEGPIIATGGALGSLLGQILRTTGSERKVLLAAGAASGMTAIFGTPISAVVLAIELLLFEFRSRSLAPIALACAVAAGARSLLFHSGPVFAMPNVQVPSKEALIAYLVIGAVIGLVAVVVTKLVYAIEDIFERLPIHWMWWPAIGGVAVGLIGLASPSTLGVGYDNIVSLLGGKIVGGALVLLTFAKLASWLIALGSGTSGGTLAPLFTIGGGIGALLGLTFQTYVPAVGTDIRLCALVGMAAMFTGASRAMLTSVIFAFEATLQPVGIFPLLGSCTIAYLVSLTMMRNTIMTEKIVRRGVVVPSDYEADYLSRQLVASCGVKAVTCINDTDLIGKVRTETSFSHGSKGHHGYPVINSEGRLAGVITRKEIFDPLVPNEATAGSLIKQLPIRAFDDNTLREAADLMVRCNVGRLPVVSQQHPDIVIGIITRSDLLQAHTSRIAEEEEAGRHIRIRKSINFRPKGNREC
ncbi:MAG: chloride channel protein [Armatimonadetes bacterium]|nr:chloride channel protein [Armatimonadota bacterium]